MFLNRSSRSRRAFFVAACLLPFTAFATDYYLGSQASTQAGVVVADLADLNSRVLHPGDRVFLQGGETFSGNLYLGSDDAGTATSPVIISSFGTGRATISAGTGAAITIYNSSGFAISRLCLVGSGAATSQGDGIDAGAYLPGSTKLPYLRFDDLIISGFKNGIELWAWYSTSTRAWPGFTDVKLTNLQVFSNRSEGIKTWGTWRMDGDGLSFSHADVSIAHCSVWDNRGDPSATDHTGSGIIMSGVDRGTVEYCLAHDNGGYGPTTGGGPYGIWTWESRFVTIQYNLVYNQKTSNTLDGGGYDLDGGSSNCVLQYNYSYNNEGPAIGIIQFQDASPLVNSVVRYNISENDCRKTTQGILYVGEFSEPYGINGADIYGNTFFVSTNPKGGNPPIISVQNNDDIANVRLRNNIFLATHTGTLITGVTNNPAKALFQGNNYWGGTFDLAAFRAGGQETLNGLPIGSRVDPQLTSPGNGGSITDPTLLPTISAYVLRSTSPLIKAGLDLTSVFGINPGSHDFYGLPILSSALDVGASAFQVSTVVVTPPIVPITLIDDQFTGSGSLSGRAPDTTNSTSQKWSILTGSSSVTNGAASTNATLRAVINSGAADCVVETPIYFGATDTGVLLRCSDGSNYLRISISTSTLRLQKTAAGTTTTVGSKSATFVLGQAYQLRAVLSGSTITISVDGVAMGTFTTTFNQTATRHGLLASNSGTRKWDRFTVSSL